MARMGVIFNNDTFNVISTKKVPIDPTYTKFKKKRYEHLMMCRRDICCWNLKLNVKRRVSKYGASVIYLHLHV